MEMGWVGAERVLWVEWRAAAAARVALVAYLEALAGEAVHEAAHGEDSVATMAAQAAEHQAAAEEETVELMGAAVMVARMAAMMVGRTAVPGAERARPAVPAVAGARVD